MKNRMINENKYVEEKIEYYKGCLVGGALGDALGYPIEFDKWKEIQSKYGKGGLQELLVAQSGKALVSDDTQMTMFAANGLVAGHYRGLMRGVGGDPYWHTYYALEDWLTTQGYDKPAKLPTTSWLLKVKELHASRAPGNTCLTALLGREPGSVSQPLNDSKGCGAVMRIAPVGLFYAAMDDTEAFLRMTAEIGAITHGHRKSHLACMFLADLIRHSLRKTVYGVEDFDSPLNAVEKALEDIERYYGKWESTPKFCALIRKAVELARSGKPTLSCIKELGAGWVAEEAVAIGLYAVLQSYGYDCKNALIVAANHSGDSDSTAAIAGSIYGALFGYGNLPMDWVKDLELNDVIAQLAVDMAVRFPGEGSRSPKLNDTYWSGFYKYEEMEIGTFDYLCLAKRRLETAEVWNEQGGERAGGDPSVELVRIIKKIEAELRKVNENRRAADSRKNLDAINGEIDRLFGVLQTAWDSLDTGLTVTDALSVFNQLKNDGRSDEDILGALYMLYKDGKLNTNELRSMLKMLGYEFTKEFEAMSEEDKHTKGMSKQKE